MNNEEPITNNLNLFGRRELQEAAKILMAWADYDYARELPELDLSDVELFLNEESGIVFLGTRGGDTFFLNEELDGSPLDIFLHCSECGNEGFAEHLIENPKCEECAKIAAHYAERRRKELS